MKGGLPIYPVERVITSTGESFNDGEHIIYVNGDNKDSATALGKKLKNLSLNKNEYDKSKFGATLYGGKCMYYSYVMGIGDEIYSLEEKGFAIERFGDDYGVSFPKEMAGVWEDFITRFLEIEYWNEYLTEKGVVFLFHLQEGIRRYEVENYLNDEVLALCEKLCECEFSSIKEMLKENEFYKDKIV